MDELETKTDSTDKPVCEIVQLNLVGTWEYDVETDICKLCKNPLTFSSPDNEEVDKVSKYNISLGNCDHAFHNNCIETWLKSSKSCPTCFTDFSYKFKTLDDPHWMTTAKRQNS